jgi:signal peptidase II
VQERGVVAALTPVEAEPVAPPRYGLTALVAGAVVAVDQLTKWWALHTLPHRDIYLVGPIRLALTRNTGGAFSLGAGYVPFVALAATALVIVLVTAGRAVVRPVLAIAVGLVLGGAVGNLADRVFRAPGGLRGAVVDFVDLRWWPVFNVADAAITVGCVALALAGGWRARREG